MSAPENTASALKSTRKVIGFLWGFVKSRNLKNIGLLRQFVVTYSDHP